MPFITFVKDVRNDDGPLYAAGYQADVTEKTARKWIGSGDALLGQHDVIPTKAKRGEKAVRPLSEPKVEVAAEVDGGE